MTLLRTIAWLLMSCCTSICLAQSDSYEVIAYHDVRDFVQNEIDPDQYAISTAKLIEHFNWLKINNFVPISVDDIVRARDGRQALPTNAVLLTFDDGFKSVYTHVYPLLKLFNYPAVVSIVTAWTNGDSPAPDDGPYGGKRAFLTWPEIREMQQSGLVEIASHSHDLHRGVVGNPQGNEQPGAVTLAYRDGRYESTDEYRRRIGNDLQRSTSLIAEQTGRRPRVMTWPYGEYNEVALEIARKFGMPLSLTLENGTNYTTDSPQMRRHLVVANPGFDQLALDLLFPAPPPIVRMAQVDLDYVYDPDEQQQEFNLGLLLDRIKALEISHVFLQAFADPDADGGAQSVYFPNRHLPMRTDLFNRVAWQLKTRSNVRVYGWLPLLSFDSQELPADARVQQLKSGKLLKDELSEPRLSVFDSRARQLIREIYEDLAAHAPLDGILFHDDGRLNEFEDASPAAMSAYRYAFGSSFSPPTFDEDPALATQWAQFKTAALNEFSLSLADAVRRFRPAIRTVRNAFSGTLLDPHGEIYLAQNFDSMLASYDYLALMAMPYFENAPSVEAYFRHLVGAVSARPDGFQKTIFELQTVDWRTGKVIPAEELSQTMRWLQANGVRHIGYYPDDFIRGEPDLAELRRGISLGEFPIGGPP